MRPAATKSLVLLIALLVCPVVSAQGQPLSIANPSLPDGIVVVPYHQQLFAAGGTGPYTWTITAGSLPAGMLLDAASGILSGTPTVAGDYRFTVQAADQAQFVGQKALTLKIVPGFGDLIVVDWGSAYRVGLDGTKTLIGSSLGHDTDAAVDPTTGDVYVVTVGSGVWKIATDGSRQSFYTGTLGDHAVAIAVDGNSNVYLGDNSDDAVYKLNPSGQIVDAAGGSTTSPLAFLPSSPGELQDITMLFDRAGHLLVGTDAGNTLHIQSISPAGVSVDLYTAGPTPPSRIGGMTFANDGSGALVVTDSLQKSLFKLTDIGTPSMAATTLLSLASLPTNLVGLAAHPTNRGEYYVLVNNAPGPSSLWRVMLGTNEVTQLVGFSGASGLAWSRFNQAPYLAISPASVPDGTVGVNYSQQFLATNLTGGATWTVTGSLPPGLALDAARGVLRGTPTQAGDYRFILNVTSSGQSAHQALTLKIVPGFGALVVSDGLGVYRVGLDGSKTPIDGSPAGAYGVAADADGNGYAVLAPAAPGVWRIPPAPGAPLQLSTAVGGVALAADRYGNMYVGDNAADVVYKLNSDGVQVDSVGNITSLPFVVLPRSSSELQDIRMIFDRDGYLLVASDATGAQQIQRVSPSGEVTSLFVAGGAPFIRVGGIAFADDGSGALVVADPARVQLIKISNPGTPSMVASTLITSSSLCCNMVGMVAHPTNPGEYLVAINSVNAPGANTLWRVVPANRSVTPVAGFNDTLDVAALRFSQQGPQGGQPATLTLENLNQAYAGTPRAVSVTTAPTGVSVVITYTGTSGMVFGPSTTPPINAGTYQVDAVAQGGYQGWATATLTVNKAVLTVMANDMTVGSGSAMPNLTASITGFVNGDTPAPPVLTGVPVLTPQSYNVGTNVILVSVGTLQAANYTFITVPGTLTVTSDALQLFNNYFVTGDFVTGSVVLRGTGVNGKATGTITIPSNDIPATAEIVAAYLYWQTVEDGSTTPGSLQGTFRGYGVNGEKLGGDLPYSDATANGVMRFYRANVLGFLPLGTDGRRLATGSHPVSLPDNGSAGGHPVTPGATLVVIYRVMSKTEALRAVVIYDGAFSAPAGGYLHQTVRGFFDADGSPAKLAYLWSQQGFWQGMVGPGSVGGAGAYQISLDYTSLSQSTALSAVVFSTPVSDSDNDGLLNAWETNGGYYDAHDNSWVDLPDASTGQKDLFIQIDYMCGQVKADGTCDTVNGHSHLPSLDALRMVADAFLAEPGDIRVHFAVGNNYQDPRPDFIVPASYEKGGNPIKEETCHDDVTVDPPQFCPFPEQPGVLAWKTNLGILKTWPKDLAACANDPVNGCTPRFQHGGKDSYHYVVFAHGLGLPRWSFQDGGITGITVDSNTNTATINTLKPHEVFVGAHVTISGAVTQPGLNRTYLVSAVSVDGLSFTVQTDENVTASVASNTDSGLFITVGELPTWSFNYRLDSIESGEVRLTNPHALLPGDHVTIARATTGGLNGTYEVSAVGTNTVAGKTYYTFTIPVGSAHFATDPELSIISAQGGTVSGYADVGGADVAIALGKWLDDGATDTTVAGTLMHELGHNLALTHGGYFFDAPNVPTFEPNCKPNYQSVMNYLFQVDLLRNSNGEPVVGYSGQQLDPLSEAAGLGNVKFLGRTDPGGFVFPEFSSTSWYTFDQPASLPTPATRHCDGTPLQGETMYRVKGDAGAISPAWADSQDVNFDGDSSTSMRGYSDWDNLDLRQIGATGGEFFAAGFYAPGGGFYAPGGGFWAAGGGFYAPGGGFWAPGGGFYAPGGGFYAPGGGFYAPGGGFYAPGGGFYAPGGGFYAPGGGFWAPGGGFYAPGGGFYAPGGGFYAPGGGFYAPGGGFYAPGGGFWAPGGGFYAPGGGFWAPGGGTSMGADLTYEAADSVVREPENVTVKEGTIPGTVIVEWRPPIFGQAQTYNVYLTGDTQPVTCLSTDPLYTCTVELSGTTRTVSVSTVLLDGRESVPAAAPAEKRAQSIWLSPLPDRVFSTVPFDVTAVASSGADVAISGGSGDGACTVAPAGENRVSVTMNHGGTCTITARQAGDSEFNSAEISRSFTIVGSRTEGFFAPVAMTLDVYNTVKGGSTVPLKFKVYDFPAGTLRTDTGVVKSFQVKQLPCAGTLPEDAVDYVTTGGTSLRYDSTLGGFVQNWLTPKTKGCYQVSVQLQDGVSLTAAFMTK